MLVGHDTNAKSETEVIGGVWGDHPRLPAELFTKLQQARVAPTPANRDKWAQTHRDPGDLKVPKHYTLVDWYAMAILTLLSPVMAVMYALVWILAFPAAAISFLYLLAITKPMKTFKRDLMSFQLLSVTIWLLSLPVKMLVLAYWGLVAMVILLASVIYAVVSLRILQFGTNWAVLQEFRKSPQWTWNDHFTGLMGAMWRQGFFEFYFYFPTLLIGVPVLKYLLVANPFLHDLSSKYCNQWTAYLGLEDTHAIGGIVQSISWALHQEADRAEIDNNRFAAHYPFPPPGRDNHMVVGVQFTNRLINFTNTIHNINGTVARSKSGKRGIYVVPLYYWNPCHIMTGYVEVNLQFEGCIEHPMWCVTGKNYWGNRFFKNVDMLFWNYAPEAAEYFEEHANLGLAAATA